MIHCEYKNNNFNHNRTVMPFINAKISHYIWIEIHLPRIRYCAMTKLTIPLLLGIYHVRCNGITKWQFDLYYMPVIFFVAQKQFWEIKGLNNEVTEVQYFRKNSCFGRFHLRQSSKFSKKIQQFWWNSIKETLISSLWLCSEGQHAGNSEEIC